ncbi:KIR protein [Plasmodium coatneyi]|uniref:KIR protein n=1 Tax=Plasmodium coatneyi TaxID=208452 RepID=A0A1B1E738_9APIC|nr:KIR protein [Plasmodium coatneyi]ANQ10854.1 KIR protein [Plasmodium coatneyi]
MSETAPVAPAAAPPACSLGSITEWLTLNNSFYTNFEQYTVRSRGGDSGDVAQLKSQLPSTCSGCSKIIDDVGKIDHAYDYACRQNSPNGQSSSIGDSAPCRLFYYWFGHTYWSDLKNHALSKVVDKIYQTLGNSFSSERMKCEFKYEDDIDQTIFGHMKIIFEYYNDYKQLQGKLTTTSSTCAKEWSTYWTTLSTACKAMENICTEEGTSDHSSKQYCTDFNNTYAVHCNTANLHQEMEELITQTLPEAVRSATTTSSLSSIFGTLATIGAPFLLYKVSVQLHLPHYKSE